MGFVEQYFGVSPDGGSGLTELMLFVTILIIGVSVAGAIALRRSQRRHHRATLV